MRKVLKIDINGFFIEDVLLKDGEVAPLDCIDVMCPQGFYKPKWNGSEWVEGLTQAEIDALKLVPQEPSEAERLDALEDAMLFII